MKVIGVVFLKVHPETFAKRPSGALSLKDNLRGKVTGCPFKRSLEDLSLLVVF
jgi:hypothetical protein